MESRVALITGAAKGVGAAVSRKLASLGYQLLINYNRSATEADALASELSGVTRTAAYRADVSDSAQVDQMFAFCRSEFGRLDVLVNNASYSSPSAWHASVDQIDWTEWDKTIQVDLKGTMMCSAAAFRIMEPQKSGKIVNFASSAAMWGDVPTYFYTAAKFAIVGVTRTLSRAFAPHVQVNCIAPGSIATDWVRKWKLSAADLEAIAKEAPLQRIGTPEEVAELVALLASPTCTFITGQTIAIDGGILLL